MSPARFLWVGLLVLALCPPVRAVWAPYSPFAAGKAPACFPQGSLQVVSHGYYPDEPFFFEFFRADELSSCLRIDWGEKNARITIPARDRQPAFSAPIEGSAICDVEACVTDLNGDARPDFVVVTRSNGNGLPGDNVMFLLSSARGYVAREVFAYGAALSDLIDLDGDGRPEFLHCMLVYGGKGSDGRNHNYWAYNLLGFSDTDLVPVNSVSAEFPKWVAFTHAPNHRDSAQLTALQRQLGWLQAWRGQSGISAADVFPHFEAVAREQGRALLNR